MAEKMGEIYAEITADSTKFNKELDSAVKNAEKGGDKISNSFGKIAGAVAGAVAGLMALKKTIDVMKDFEQAARRQKNAVRMVNAQIQATGQRAGFTTNQLTRLAAELQKVSNFGDEQIMEESISSMLKFENVTGDVMERAIKLSVDMASVTGNLSGSAELLGRSLNDPTLALTQLRRQGIAFTEAEKELVKEMVATNRTAEAQAIILNKLESSYSGMAKSMIQPMKQLANLTGDLKELLGADLVRATDRFASKMIPVLTDIIEMTKILNTDTETLAKNIEDMSVKELEELRESYRKVLFEMEKQVTTGQAIAFWWQSIGRYIQNHFIPNIGKAVVKMSPLLIMVDGMLKTYSKITGQQVTLLSIIEDTLQAYTKNFLVPLDLAEKLLDNIEAVEKQITFADASKGAAALKSEIIGIAEAIEDLKQISMFDVNLGIMEDYKSLLNIIKQEELAFAEIGEESKERLTAAWEVYLAKVIEIYGEDSRQFRLSRYLMEQDMELFVESSVEEIEKLANKTDEFAEQMGNSIASNLGSGLADVIMQTKTVEEAFKNMADAIIRDLIRIAVRLAILTILELPTGGAGGVVAAAIGAASNKGGTVHDGLSGGGTVTRGSNQNVDSVLVPLTKGEEVINRQSAQINRPLLKAINSDPYFMQNSGSTGGIGINTGSLVNAIKSIAISPNITVINKIDPVAVNKANNIGQQLRGGI